MSIEFEKNTDGQYHFLDLVKKPGNLRPVNWNIGNWNYEESKKFQTVIPLEFEAESKDLLGQLLKLAYEHTEYQDRDPLVDLAGWVYQMCHTGRELEDFPNTFRLGLKEKIDLGENMAINISLGELFGQFADHTDKWLDRNKRYNEFGDPDAYIEEIEAVRIISERMSDTMVNISLSKLSSNRFEIMGIETV